MRHSQLKHASSQTKLLNVVRTSRAGTQQTTSHRIPHSRHDLKKARSELLRQLVKRNARSSPRETRLGDLFRFNDVKRELFGLFAASGGSGGSASASECSGAGVGLKRQYARFRRACKGKGGRLFRVLAEKSTQVLHYLVWRLSDVMLHAKLDERSDCVRRPCLELNILFALRRKTISGNNEKIKGTLTLTPFMIPLTTGLTLSGVLLNATNAEANAADTRTSCCALTVMYRSMLCTTSFLLSPITASSRFFVR